MMAAATAAHWVAVMVGRLVAMLVSWTAAPTVARKEQWKAVLMADLWAVKMDSSMAAYWAAHSVEMKAVYWDMCWVALKVERSAVRTDAKRAE